MTKSDFQSVFDSICNGLETVGCVSEGDGNEVFCGCQWSYGKGHDRTRLI